VSWQIVGTAVIVMAAAAALPAQALQDPTRPPGIQSQAVAAMPPRPLELGSIVHGSDRRVAVIEGVALTEGESHDGIRVRRIYRDRVEILDNGQHRVLYPETLPQVRRTQ
jgi:MSHA biogenesis protein MshK